MRQLLGTCSRAILYANKDTAPKGKVRPNHAHGIPLAASGEDAQRPVRPAAYAVGAEEERPMLSQAATISADAAAVHGRTAS